MNNLWQWLLGTRNRPGLDGPGSWGLTFTAEYDAYVTLAILVALGVMVWLTVRSYRREGEHKPAVKIGLAAVRVAIIVLCVGALFKPAAVLSNNRVLHSAVIVLIDDSQSMTVKDRYADAAVAKELSTLLGVEPSALAGVSRLEIVKAALLRQGGAVARLAREHPIRVMKFSPGSSNANEVDSLGVVEEMTDDVAVGDAPTPQPLRALLEGLRGEGHSTNVASAIRRTLESAQGQRIAGLVVISDGRQTAADAGNRLQHALEYAQARGIAMYSVVVGDPTPTKNLTVMSLQAPREMRKTATVDMTAKLAHRNLDGQTVTVKLYANSQDPDEWQFTGVETTVTLEPTHAGVQDVVLKIDSVPDQLGTWMYKALVEPLPEESNVEDNQSAPVQVTVVDSMVNVLLVSGDSGWEFQFLRNAIQRQPDLYRLSVWQQNAEKGISQASSAPDMRLEKLPRELPELVYDEQTKKGFHVIILYDPEYTSEGFDHAFCANLKAFVDQGKGGVLYVAGNKYTNDHLVLREKAIGDLQDIMPVQLSANMTMMDLLTERQADAWRVCLTLAGRDHPITGWGRRRKMPSASGVRPVWAGCCRGSTGRTRWRV